MPPPPLTSDDFVVISAVNDDAILAACLERSPDIAAGLPLVVVRGARSMPEAYNRGLAATTRPICIFAHQDVYLPSGWLALLMQRLEALEGIDPTWRIVGPYGVRADGRHVGRVYDVTLGRELGEKGFAPAPIVSLDEYVLIVRRDDAYQLDPQLPHFHLYGTDMVQEALAEGRSAYAIELPAVHNNRPIASLRGGYARAYRYARRKWTRHLPIPTTICDLSWNPLHLWRAQRSCRYVKFRPEALLADSVEMAERAGYEHPRTLQP